MAELKLLAGLDRAESTNLGASARPLEVDVNVLIEAAGREVVLTVIPSPRWEALFPERIGVNDTSIEALDVAIARCIDVWHQNVGDMGPVGKRVFRSFTKGPLHQPPYTRAS